MTAQRPDRPIVVCDVSALARRRCDRTGWPASQLLAKRRAWRSGCARCHAAAGAARPVRPRDLLTVEGSGRPTAGRAWRCRGRTSSRRFARLRARAPAAPTAVAVARGARLVLPEPRAAVARRSGSTREPEHSIPGPNHQVKMSSGRSARVVRRIDCVASSRHQRRQGVHVVALEGAT